MKKPCQNSTTQYCKVLLFTCILVITFAEITSRAQTIDCRIHLYAPICRGVAAKRALLRSYVDGLGPLEKKMSWDYPPLEYAEV